LGVYYKDEGATYSFFKNTFPDSPLAASLIGWWVIFGYISTLALYAYTFSSYAISSFSFADNDLIRKLVSGVVIATFALINIWSVKGMGKVEDLMVYTKVVILMIISFVLLSHNQTTLPALVSSGADFNILNILVIASITFVAYEGFQLVINAVNEMESPEKNIPRAIYSAIFIAILLYIVISIGAILALPFEDIIKNKEYALASGASNILGHWGTDLMVTGALLATSSAISGTLFGASRQMSVIAADGNFPAFLKKRRNYIPVYAILTMAGLAFCLILLGDLEVILEFGSITFLLVSLLMAYTNFKIRHLTRSSTIVTILSMVSLLLGVMLIIYYEIISQVQQLIFIGGLYGLLTLGAVFYSRK